MSEQEKVLFSWRVIEEEDGTIRTESYIHPEWKEGKGFDFGPGFGPMAWGKRRHHHGPGGHRHEHGPRRRMKFEMGFPPFGPMAFGWGGPFGDHERGRKRARRMLDWFEQMYEDFYSAGDEDDYDEGAPAAAHDDAAGEAI